MRQNCYYHSNTYFLRLFSCIIKNMFLVYLTYFFAKYNIKKTERLRVSSKSFGSNGDPYGIRTHVIAVKGRCLNHLTKGPCLVAATGFEPVTLRV